MTDTYNGWTNRETWAFWLHVTNDEGLWGLAADFARDNGRDLGSIRLGEALTEHVQEILEESASAGNEYAWGAIRDIGSWWRIDALEIGNAARELARVWECDCDEDEDLPCEEHMIVLAQREGASTRTADELLAVWLDDAAAVPGVEVSPWGQEVMRQAWDALERNRAYGVAWLPDDVAEGLRDDMETLRDQLETSLATLDDPVSTHWDDGYVMYRVSSDSPLAGE
jgi:hypothetical protein